MGHANEGCWMKAGMEIQGPRTIEGIKGADFTKEAIAEAYKDWLWSPNVTRGQHTFRTDQGLPRRTTEEHWRNARHDSVAGKRFSIRLILARLCEEGLAEREAEPAAQPSDKGPGLYDRGKALGVTRPIWTVCCA